MSDPFFGGDLLSSATQYKPARTGRFSSWDHTGQNDDAFIVMPGETAVLADVEGPGKITHLWFVQVCRQPRAPGSIPYQPTFDSPGSLGPQSETNDKDFYRKVVLKMYWDDSETPSVLAPLGDFFCVGHSMPANFQSMPFTVSVVPWEHQKYGGAAALNCYLPMPFNKRARIEVENQGENAYMQYFYIDYELSPEPLDLSKTLYLHAHWKRENPTDGWAPSSIQTNSTDVQVPNLDGKDNYTLLETTGRGTFIGCNHSVTHFQDTWWGEGDDMIWIDDDEAWPPSLHGTGGEDYFSQGWGMQKNAYPFCGSIIHESDVPNFQVSYRWHLADPVRFNSRIKVTLEHGHANHLRDDWSTTAYWYQSLPGPKLEILPLEKRIPRKRVLEWPADRPAEDEDDGRLTELQKDKIKEHKEKFAAFVKDKERYMEDRAKQSRERAKRNIEYAKGLRKRFDESLKSSTA
jgi:hypothetical protein